MDVPHHSSRIHDAMAYATLVYGESATMASEAAVLGTPAIYLDDEGRGYTDEQERKYGLVFNFSESLQDQERSVEKAAELLKRDDIKEIYNDKKLKLLQNTIDVTDYLIRVCTGQRGNRLENRVK
jgi:uncharacterized protein